MQISNYFQNSYHFNYFKNNILLDYMIFQFKYLISNKISKKQKNSFLK